jgi:DNA-binding transcriptional MocR family regulator
MFVSTQYRIEGTGVESIAASVEQGVRDGGLAPGDLLPPVRRLAVDVGCSATTVAAAYARLRRAGLVETDGRRGTRVRPRPATAARASWGLSVPPGARDLASGEPDPGFLPPLGPMLARVHPAAPGYPRETFLPALRDAAQARLTADGVPADGLTVCNGALDATERVLLAHLVPGDRVAVEDPGWANLLDLIAALGLEPLPVAIDDDGPRPDALEKALRRGARAVLLTSRAQNPTGAALTADRAEALRAVLGTALVIEDDHAGELAGVPLATLAGSVPHWAFVRSVSKPYGPDLRCALLAGDAATIARVDGRRRLGPGWVSTLIQQVVLALWEDADVTALVGRAGASYDARRNALLTALRGRGVPAAGRTGLNVWVPVADETAAVTALRDAGIVVVPGSRYRIASGPGIRVTASRLPVADAAEVAAAVAVASLTTPDRARA